MVLVLGCEESTGATFYVGTKDRKEMRWKTNWVNWALARSFVLNVF